MKFISRLNLPRHRLYLLGYWFIGLLVYWVIFSPSPALAQGGEKPGNDKVKVNPFWREDPKSQVKTVEGGNEKEMSAPRYAFFQTNTTFNAISAGILDPTGQNQRAAVPLLGRSIAILTGRPPVQTHEYLAYMASKAGFIDQAYAQKQGGFEVLGPIQKLWIATRNVAYLITSLTLVVIGFMIMLRKKIDAQTIIGVEQALPNLVITLLLITFSYAIAGFVIDMIYFVSFFGIKLLALNNVFSDSGSAAIETIRTKSIFSIGIRDLFRLGGTSTGSAETAADAVGNLISELLGEGQLFSGSQIFSQPIAYVIFALTILYAVFKLFFSLLMAYIQIILLAILGPLQLMLNALPGSDAFSKWFRNLLANAMAFPAAILMLVFAAALMGQTGEHFRIADDIGFTDSTSGVKWIPPLVFGGGAGDTNPVNAVIALIGIGILLMTPKVVDMVKEAIQAPEFKYGSAIGEAVGASWGGAKAGVSRGWGATRGYSEGLAGQKDAAITEFVKLHGRGPTEGPGSELEAIEGRLSPLSRWRGPQGQLRGRIGKLFGK